MARHGTRGAAPAPRPGTPARGSRTAAPAPPSPSSRSQRVTTSSRILVAAVAAGAAIPAIQALEAHPADAASTTAELGQADLSLASSHHASRTASVAPVVPAAPAPSSRAVRSGGAGKAGDHSDVASLTKAMSVAREQGPADFGRPYQAGNDGTLDGQIAQALGLLGLPQKLAPGVKKIIMHESTGDAHAVNNSDSNAAAGTPSKGLMQLIDTTFRNAVLPSQASKGIFDPVANITAGVRTMIANHGIDALMDGGLRDSSGGYLGYGGAKLPSDGLGRATHG